MDEIRVYQSKPVEQKSWLGKKEAPRICRGDEGLSCVC